jgi:tRNA (guanine-N7-)-methyltransferase
MELSLADLAGADAFTRIFGCQAPVELEIGCGKGRFLVRCAESLPGNHFIGVERANRFFRVALARAQRRRLLNLRLLRTDALFLARHVLPSASLTAIHVLFPDPWPKKRHHKRRLFQPEFLEAVERILLAGGQLNVATDHAEYFQWILDIVGASRHLRRGATFALDERLPRGEIGHTNYEVKYRQGGRAIQQATWIRCEDGRESQVEMEKAREAV